MLNANTRALARNNQVLEFQFYCSVYAKFMLNCLAEIPDFDRKIRNPLIKINLLFIDWRLSFNEMDLKRADKLENLIRVSIIRLDGKIKHPIIKSHYLEKLKQIRSLIKRKKGFINMTTPMSRSLDFESRQRMRELDNITMNWKNSFQAAYQE